MGAAVGNFVGILLVVGDIDGATDSVGEDEGRTDSVGDNVGIGVLDFLHKTQSSLSTFAARLSLCS